MTARLEIDGVGKSFGALPVLDGLSFSVRRGEFVSLLGPSGAGKSTLFRLLTGALAADAGTIRFDGAPLDTRARPFAFMPQRDALMAWRTILDNTTLGLEIAGLSRAAARAKVAPLFAPFGLAGFEGAWPHQLSGGMRQRAALLRTLVMQKPMLLLDEPFGALDALTRAQMQLWLAGMWQAESWTALLVTHDVREAVFLSDRIVLLSPRPAHIVRDIVVDLPRPRTAASFSDPRAHALEADILTTLLAPRPRSP